MFNSIIDRTATGLDISTMLIIAGVGVALGLVIAIAHKITSRCSKEFLVTVAILPILVAVVMIMVNGNLGTSVAIAGAFALIRFRSIRANSKELLSVFFAMATGLALGMGQVLFAVVFTTIICVLEIIYGRLRIFDNGKTEQILKITIPEDLDYTYAFKREFKKYTLDHKLIKSKTINMGSLYKLTYYVSLKPEIKEKEFLDAIRVKNCNLQVLLSTGDEDREL